MEGKQGILLLLLSAGLKRLFVGFWCLISGIPARHGGHAVKLWMLLPSCCLAYLFPFVTWNSTCATIKLALVGTPPSNCTLLKITAVYLFRTPSSCIRLLCMLALIYCTEQGITVVKHGRKWCRALALWIVWRRRICLPLFALDLLVMMVLTFG